MAGLGPAIHAFTGCAKDVDGRHKGAHDDEEGADPPILAPMGLGPAIHDFTDRAKDVDGRHMGGHDEMRQPASVASSIRPLLNRTTLGQARGRC
jgi:hypothetical protein